jgi:hypothetical protein
VNINVHLRIYIYISRINTSGERRQKKAPTVTHALSINHTPRLQSTARRIRSGVWC